MTELLYGIIIGLIIGIIIVYGVMRSRFSTQLSARMTAYQAEHAEEVRGMLEAERMKTLARSRSVLKGKIGEQMAPMFREFQAKYEPSDAKFIGDPIDYVIFRNYSISKDRKKDEITHPIEVVFVDVKTGKAQLSANQRRIREAVEAGRVGFETLRVSETNYKSEDQA